MFSKITAFNEKNHFQKKLLHRQPFHIYQNFSLNNENHLTRMGKESEIRLDLFVKDPAPREIQGRYSFISE